MCVPTRAAALRQAAICSQLLCPCNIIVLIPSVPVLRRCCITCRMTYTRFHSCGCIAGSEKVTEEVTSISQRGFGNEFLAHNCTVNTLCDDCLVPQVSGPYNKFLELLRYKVLLQWQTLPLSPEIRSLQCLVTKNFLIQRVYCTHMTSVLQTCCRE